MRFDIWIGSGPVIGAVILLPHQRTMERKQFLGARDRVPCISETLGIAGERANSPLKLSENTIC
jgi:hypothetical protein